MIRARGFAVVLFAVSACKCGPSAPSTAPAAPTSATATPNAAPPAPKAGSIGPDPSLDGGVDTNAPQGPAFVQHQAPPPCSPHVDGSDPDHKLAPVETMYRRTTVDGKPALELLLLDTVGACEFDKRKPASYRALRMRLQLEGDKPRTGAHFTLGGEPKSEFALLSPGKNGSTDELRAASGIIDVMEVKPDDSLSVGFNVKTATGESFGCFIAKPCP